MNATPIPPITFICQFSGWRFNPVSGELSNAEKSLRLQPRIAKLLALFLANSDKVLTRDVLISVLWPNRIVNDDALSRCIAELRGVLGDDSATPSYIETLPKKGYRFIAAVAQQPRQSWPLRAGAAAVLVGLIVFIALSMSPNNQESLWKNAILGASRITTDTQFERQPNISNQGDQVAFSTSLNGRIIVQLVNQKGELVKEISSTEYSLYSPTFSIDDQSLLVAGLHQSDCHILLYQLADLSVQKLGHCEHPNLSSIFDWAPNGRQIAYVGKNQQSDMSAIWLYDFETQLHRQLTKPDKLDLFDSAPKFSPDSKKLGFTRGTQSIRNIYQVNLTDDLVAQQLTHSLSFIAGFDWLADGDHLIFDSNMEGDKALWLLNTNNQSTQLLGGKDAQYPTLNGRQDQLAFSEVRYNANIWALELNDSNSTARTLISSIKYNNFPTFSPDGKRIAFVSNRQGKAGIWLFDLSSAKQNRLLTLPGEDLFSPYWSNDGQSLLITGRTQNGYHCYELDLNTRQYRRLDELNDSQFNCIYLMTGEILAIGKSQQNIGRVTKLAVDGQQVQLPVLNIRRILVTEKNHIVYSRMDKEGLFISDFNGQNQRTLVEFSDSRFDGYWTIQGNKLYYPKFGANRGFWQRDLDSEVETQLTKELPSAVGHVLSVNPDHSLMVMTKTDKREANIYIASINDLVEASKDNKQDKETSRN